MQQLFSKTISGVIFNGNNKSLFSMLSDVAVTSALAVTLLFGSTAMADSADTTGNNKAVKVSQQDINSARISISHEKITAESKKKLPDAGSKFNIYSLNDGSLEGAYGDGNYGN